MGKMRKNLRNKILFGSIAFLLMIASIILILKNTKTPSPLKNEGTKNDSIVLGDNTKGFHDSIVLNSDSFHDSSAFYKNGGLKKYTFYKDQEPFFTLSRNSSGEVKKISGKCYYKKLYWTKNKEGTLYTNDTLKYRFYYVTPPNIFFATEVARATKIQSGDTGKFKLKSDYSDSLIDERTPHISEYKESFSETGVYYRKFKSILIDTLNMKMIPRTHVNKIEVLNK